MALSDRKLKQLRSTQLGETGNRLATALELSETTQMALAEAIGLTQGYVSNVARGKHAVTVENAHKFADFFGCAIEDLFPAKQAVA
jgi:transcriptional regulator with XRE-family HTH domain